ncbi:metalloprotease TldD [Pseudidiomarina gelatinasegens]|jgi:TldD protein|uniref:Metalloprotease TldD n=1 Tax=Pseudidiomarina gelatinasegens TaxID=2487740 RepID=A0A451GE19_9GAMM|nr:metalloprotease TldD [Pseudidiomarina gelatinasegens]RWU11177.1 metalloprotease TldD [Pseudidiomarina gelatinasegens]|tara:strand:+ start:1342 stop:2787 length:1446 start_codon:yes stop_codon:yes gene_type:complete
MQAQSVQDNLLKHHGLDRDALHTSLATLYTGDIDFADIYLQSSINESWVLEDGIVKEGSFHIEAGLGVRAIHGEKTGFAYADDISPHALQKAAAAARGISLAGANKQVCAFTQAPHIKRYAAVNPLASLNEQAKIDLLREIDAYARSLDSRVVEVIASISGSYDEVLIAATDGTFATDIRPLVRVNCTVLVEHDGRRERGSAGGGARVDYHYFAQTIGEKPRWKTFADEAVRQALVNLEARPAPAGTMPVVLGAGWPGVLLHEAVGHGLEGDFNRKGASAYAGKIGEMVASELCTIVDDGTINDRRGSLAIDDEGTEAGYNVLIEKGRLVGYMQDKMNARLMGVSPTGNGRRESYAHLPMPRMTNTYMLAGEHDPQDIIGSVKRGIYAPHFAGGQVDITSGKFVFSASEAYLIEDGKITAPIKGATLIGNGPDAMRQVSMVGHDLELDQGVGVCGKDGQSVPVGVGQPTLKLDALTVGGTD